MRRIRITWRRRKHMLPPPGPRRPIHWLTTSLDLACGHDGRDRCSSVPAEVTCAACKATPAWQEVA